MLTSAFPSHKRIGKGESNVYMDCAGLNYPQDEFLAFKNFFFTFPRRNYTTDNNEHKSTTNTFP